MIRSGQFTLAYLFWEILWIAATLGCFTQFSGTPPWIRTAIGVCGFVFAAAAIGGLFGRMSDGFWVGVSIVVGVTIVVSPILICLVLLWLVGIPA